MNDTYIKVGNRVTVYISNRHDFTRYAIILSINNSMNEVTVRYTNGEVETIPSWWL